MSSLTPTGFHYIMVMKETWLQVAFNRDAFPRILEPTLMLQKFDHYIQDIAKRLSAPSLP